MCGHIKLGLWGRYSFINSSEILSFVIVFPFLLHWLYIYFYSEKKWNIAKVPDYINNYILKLTWLFSKKRDLFYIAAQSSFRVFIAIGLKIPRMDIVTYFTDYFVGKIVNEQLLQN